MPFLTGSGTIVGRVLSPAPRQQWSEAVAQDPLALADHTPEWTDGIVDSAPWSDASRLYRLDDGSAVVLPLLRHRRAPGWLANPPYGWGFGGLVGARAHDPAVIRDVLDDVSDLWSFRLRLRPDPLTGSLWTACSPARTHRLVRSRAHVLDLRPGADALFAAMKKETRRHIRRCESRGLDVEVGSGPELIETYQQLRRMSVVRWAERTHEPLWLAVRRARWSEPPERMYSLASRMGDRFRLWVVRVDGRPVAASLVTLGRNARATRAAMDRERLGGLGVMAYLDWLAIRDACAAGARWYHLGDSGTSASLATYKEALGAAAYDYDEIRFEPAAWTATDAAARRAVKRVLGVVT